MLCLHVVCQVVEHKQKERPIAPAQQCFSVVLPDRSVDIVVRDRLQFAYASPAVPSSDHASISYRSVLLRSSVWTGFADCRRRGPQLERLVAWARSCRLVSPHCRMTLHDHQLSRAVVGNRPPWHGALTLPTQLPPWYLIMCEQIVRMILYSHSARYADYTMFSRHAPHSYMYTHSTFSLHIRRTACLCVCMYRLCLYIRVSLWTPWTWIPAIHHSFWRVDSAGMPWSSRVSTMGHPTTPTHCLGSRLYRYMHCAPSAYCHRDVAGRAWR